MQEFPQLPLRVFVVWERVLVSDRLPPTTGGLSRISDRRAAQFWDKRRWISQKILETASADPNHPFARCCAPARIVWDAVGVFPKGARWDGPFPAPNFAGAPVVKVIDEVRQHLRLLAAESAPHGARREPPWASPQRRAIAPAGGGATGLATVQPELSR